MIDVQVAVGLHVRRSSVLHEMAHHRLWAHRTLIVGPVINSCSFHLIHSV